MVITMLGRRAMALPRMRPLSPGGTGARLFRLDKGLGKVSTPKAPRIQIFDNPAFPAVMSKVRRIRSEANKPDTSTIPISVMQSLRDNPEEQPACNFQYSVQLRAGMSYDENVRVVAKILDFLDEAYSEPLKIYGEYPSEDRMGLTLVVIPGSVSLLADLQAIPGVETVSADMYPLPTPKRRSIIPKCSGIDQVEHEYVVQLQAGLNKEEREEVVDKIHEEMKAGAAAEDDVSIFGVVSRSEFTDSLVIERDPVRYLIGSKVDEAVDSIMAPAVSNEEQEVVLDD
ncbi:hypothetical protein PRZ48_008764 [Zasmidium cellare]|uniref:Uncharacterized protein n=1 Tax=Zasmidium cellare TaxID=395010 RepID=A0ABR0EH17_ZASCE|nr:hypothetical protein PRZ48_008764 [Zasmidium cellare]